MLKSTTGKYDKTLNSYMESIQDNTPLSAKEQNRLVKLAQEGDAKARAKLIESNLKFVVFFIMSKCKNNRVDMWDLVSVGNIGLMNAIDKYDPKFNVNFITYARWQILAELKTFFRTCRDFNSLDELSQTDSVTDNENDTVTIAGDKNSQPVTQDYEECFLYNEEQEQRNHQALVKYFMKDLDDRQAYIINHLFGLNGCSEMKLEEIAKELGMTIEYVRKIKEKTIKKFTFQAVEKPELQTLYYNDVTY